MSAPNTFTSADVLGYGHAAYCAGWRAALKAVAGKPLAETHGYDWLRDHPTTADGEPLWRGLPQPATEQAATPTKGSIS